MRPNLTPETEPAAGQAVTLEIEAQVRQRIGAELRRAFLPEFAPGENVDLAIRTVRSIYIRLVERGHASDYWRPEAPPDAPPPLWATAAQSVDWLDTKNGTGDHETAMRLMKLTEEAGEVMQAYIGTQGQNPRKGVTHTRADVAAELCDVILTAAVALHQFTDNPAETLDHHAARVGRRIDQIKER
ncbi:MazG-like family protein [Streptomyces syringium]|uniref:MazG-like family protein n=1 Tax=Streptomyces syringium TaxID=76729 RepID=UPI0037D01003